MAGGAVLRAVEFREPVTLAGRHVRLVHLERGHAPALAAAAQDPVVWRYLPYGPCTTTESMQGLIDELLRREAAGTDLNFAVLATDTQRPIGMTRFLEIDRAHDRVEVGGTWYDRAHRRTPVNTEAKYLLLRHAFETERAHRVQLKTDLRNLASQAAIERIGAVREGILREHLRMPDGFRRSSVVYSLLAHEWPAARSRLEDRLARPWLGPARAATEAGTLADASPERR